MKRLLSLTSIICFLGQEDAFSPEAGKRSDPHGRYACDLSSFVELERVMQRLNGQLHVFAVDQNRDLDL